jgi:hypothetical protein
MHNNNLEIVRQSQAFKENFLNQFPPNYRGAVGHLVCHALRDANLDPEKALQQLRINGERWGNQGAWQHINQASDRILKVGLYFYGCHEKLTTQEKVKAKQGSFYNAPPSPPITDNTDQWLEWYEKIVAIQKSRNYKQGWIYYQLKNSKAPNCLMARYQELSL